MSNQQNDVWLEEQKERFDVLMDSPDLDNIEKAYSIILELEENGFKSEALELENKWGEITKEVAPNYYKEFTRFEE
jgi:hypothetical protein